MSRDRAERPAVPPTDIDVVPLEDGVAAKCDVCGRRAASCLELEPDARVSLCPACVGVLRTEGMARLRSVARRSRSSIASALPTGPVRVRILERER